MRQQPETNARIVRLSSLAALTGSFFFYAFDPHAIDGMGPLHSTVKAESPVGGTENEAGADSSQTLVNDNGNRIDENSLASVDLERMSDSRRDGAVSVRAIPDRSLRHPDRSKPREQETTNAHLIDQTLRIVKSGHHRCCGELEDYTCRVVKQTRVDGKLSEPETLIAKVKHWNNESQESSLYLRFDQPSSVAGREILYPSEEGSKEMLVRRGGRSLAFLTVELAPTHPMALRGNLYPVTEFGIKRLAERLIACAEKERECAHLEVSLQDREWDGRDCVYLEVRHPEKSEHAECYFAKIYIDKEMNLPVMYEAYDWPESEGAEPPLKERYAYHDIKWNVGLSAKDFDRKHPEYRFK